MFFSCRLFWKTREKDKENGDCIQNVEEKGEET